MSNIIQKGSVFQRAKCSKGTEQPLPNTSSRQLPPYRDMTLQDTGRFCQCLQAVDGRTSNTECFPKSTSALNLSPATTFCFSAAKELLLNISESELRFLKTIPATLQRRRTSFLLQLHLELQRSRSVPAAIRYMLRRIYKATCHILVDLHFYINRLRGKEII